MGREVSVGGLRNFCTHPDHHRQELATSLLLDLLLFMRERGLLISMLFADIHRFYRRLGWEVALPFYSVTLDTESLPRGALEALELSPFRDEDLDKVATLYSRSYALTNCSVVRDRG